MNKLVLPETNKKPRFRDAVKGYLYLGLLELLLIAIGDKTYDD